MKKQVIFTLMIVVTSFIGFTQGSIDVSKDDRLDALVDKQSAVIPPKVKTQIDGYRIQLFFDQERTAINAARSNFLSKYPRIPTYVDYQAPYYYLKVGDFRTHLEAVRIKSTVKADFQTSFVIKEKVYLPQIEKQEIHRK